MSNQAPEKGPYKHFERPSTSRSQRRSTHHFDDESSSKDIREGKKKNLTSLWSLSLIHI